MSCTVRSGMKWRALILALLALPVAFGIAGCNPQENENEDVREAQEKLDEERRDAAAED